MAETLAWLLTGYLLGSIPTGYWLVKYLKGIDIRTQGSGSTGATNVLRAAGKKAAALVLIVDVLKGCLPVCLASYFESTTVTITGAQSWHLLAPAVALCTLIGHSKSIFLKFQGGKSAATALGTLLALNWLCGLGVFALWIFLVWSTRLVSVASMTAGVFSVLLMWLLGNPVSHVGYCVLGAVYVIYRHMANIKRLLNGTEPKLGAGAATSLGSQIVILATMMLANQAATAQSIKSSRSKPVSKASPANLNQPFISAEEAITIGIYKNTNKAVVNITTSSTVEDVFMNILPREGSGSGSIISSDGYILTNNHVIEGARALKVTLFNGNSVPAKLVGADPANDLAIVKIDAPPGINLTTLKLGDSSKLEVGRKVLAIGNPFGLDRTLTQGIVSSIGRTLKTENGRLIKGIIQTDAAINPGNSGGPLLDTAGNMVGINTAILSKAGQSAGIGFAIPVNIAKRIVPELIAHHQIIRPELGILSVQPIDSGLRVINVDPNGPAGVAGISGPKEVNIRNGPFLFHTFDISQADIITGVDNIKVKSPDDLLSYIDNKKPGQIVTLSILRQGRLLKIPVKLSVTNQT